MDSFLPCDATKAKLHCLLGNSVSSRQRPARQAVIFPIVSRLFNLIPSKLVKAVVLSGGNSPLHSSFFNLVTAVVGVRTKPKMCRINARRIIASVKNASSFWNWTYVQNPRRDVCKNWHGRIKTFVELAVSRPVLGTSPKPAPKVIRQYKNLVEKPFNYGCGKTLLLKVLRSNFVHRLVVARLGLLARPSFFSFT